MDATLDRSQESRGSNASTNTTYESTCSGEIGLWNKDGAQIVLVLVGLIASGKSTFAKALVDNFPEFCRCNQDDLHGGRRAVESLARDSLGRGLSVCIDRTNFDKIQRSHWINIAREFPSTKLWCIVFNTPSHICRERLQHRTNHPTIHSPEQGIQVLNRLKNAFVAPSADEGFDRIFDLKPEDHPSTVYSRDEIQTLLTRVASSPPCVRSAPQRGIREYFDTATPRGAVRREGWRNRDNSRGRGFPGPKSDHWRNHGRNISAGSTFRANESRNAVQSTSHSAWRSNFASFQRGGRDSRGRTVNAFQNNGCIARAADQAPSPISQSDLVKPLKQPDNGTSESPILIE